MSKHAQHLAQRRQALIARSQQQRAIISLQAQQLTRSLSIVDLGLAMVAKVKGNPLLLSAVLLGLLVIKPRRVLSVLRTGLVALQAWRSVGPVLHHLTARRRTD
ncbi:YqjK family protein [Undibacterium arcticum]|uniref:YqjK family protein n=1 Tax=Undibacterium arcticum TaxID=1762892 RepID=A0ABV7F6W3_9BURK